MLPPWREGAELQSFTTIFIPWWGEGCQEGATQLMAGHIATRLCFQARAAWWHQKEKAAPRDQGPAWSCGLIISPDALVGSGSSLFFSKSLLQKPPGYSTSGASA